MALFRLDTAEFKNHSLEQCQAKKCKECEIPIIFRLNCPNKGKPTLNKGGRSARAILEGSWANSEKSNRPSFTCYSYQVLKDHE